jgi:hypothetical protein
LAGEAEAADQVAEMPDLPLAAPDLDRMDFVGGVVGPEEPVVGAVPDWRLADAETGLDQAFHVPHGIFPRRGRCYRWRTILVHFRSYNCDADPV